MSSFASQYRSLFERFGFPLGPGQAVDQALLDRASARLGVPIPTALSEYYAVAGNEKRFNRSLQQFLSPSKWFFDQQRLVFLEENQSVCWWGVSTKARGAKDPMVSQAVNSDDTLEWFKLHDHCSTFIKVILHYQAVSGGFSFTGSCGAPDDAHLKLKKSGWQYAGEVNQLWAFSRPNQAICIMPGGGQPWMPAMLLLAGGKTKADLISIGECLGVSIG